MNPFPDPATEPFNLLSIGQRGVGKTVFLAGSYAELHSGSQTPPQPVWFDCQNSQVQRKIEEILNYVAQTGQYPPPTMKVTDFNFRLVFRDLLKVQTVCDFRWWDIPGEICNVHNPDFRQMVITSQGCCVFIDAYALMYEPTYLQALEDILEQVMAVVALVSLNRLKYAFALILTKADLLDPGLLSQRQPEENLTLLTAHLDAVGVNYQIFYSVIPIVSADAGFSLKATGAATPLLWLVWELSKAHAPSLATKLPKSVIARLSSYLESQQTLVNDLTQPSDASDSTGIRKRLDLLGLRLKLLPTAQRYILVMALACVSSVGLIIGLRFYEQVLQR